MSKIQDLENELRRLKLAEYEKKRMEALKNKEDWRKNNQMDVYTSDDYCGLRAGGYSFYFGYEVTQNNEWCFTADVDGREVMKLKQSEISPETDEEPFWYLVAGIGHFLKRLHSLSPKEKKS